MKTLIDPVRFVADAWPDVKLYKQQREILQSVAENDETVVVAGNMLGKDFVAGLACLWFYLVHHPCRIVATSVKDDHLRVLFGEVGRFIRSCKYPLRHEEGGMQIKRGDGRVCTVGLVTNHRDIRKVINGVPCTIDYFRGMVSAKGESMAGHHAAYTLAVIDEASGVDDEVYTQMDTWAKRKLIFGNPNDCQNFFRKAVQEGDILAPAG